MKNLRSLKPALPGDSYANLVTVFAVIATVEYGTGRYDLWDFLIGLIAVVLGSSFFGQAKKHSDFWYSFIASALVSLGVVSMLSFALESAFALIGWRFPAGEGVEIIRFVGFLVLALLVKRCFIGHSSNAV